VLGFFFRGAAARLFKLRLKTMLALGALFSSPSDVMTQCSYSS
jgi:hypothetical protein